MIELGITRTAPEVETRSGTGSYTDLVLAGLMAQQGRSSGAAASWATGAVQSAAGLWARCLSMARSDVPVVTAECLGAIAYDLATQGEHLSVLHVDADGVQLLRGASWDIAGSADRRSWVYNVTLSGPTGTHTRVVPDNGVLHVRYLPDRSTPWRGVAPWRRAPTLSTLAAEIEAQLLREAKLPTRQIIPIPSGTGKATGINVKEQLQDGTGIVMPETTAAGYGGGRQAAPQRDFRVSRLQAEPADGIVALCKDIPNQIGGLYGIPPVLTSGGGSETQTREAFRRLVLTTIDPIALLIEKELSRALGETVDLDLDQLVAYDIAGRARAFKALTGAGMSASDAAHFAGLESDD